MLRRKPWNGLEHHRRRPHGALVDIHDAADLLVALGAGDGDEFAGLLHQGEPGAQILLGRIAHGALAGARFEGVQHRGSRSLVGMMWIKIKAWQTVVSRADRMTEAH